MVDNSRRKTIGKVILLSTWIPPTISITSLPAHAQTSNGIIYSYGRNANLLPIPISVVIYGETAIIRVRHFFDGGCNICGSDVEYEGRADIYGTPSPLIVVDYGCGVSAPEVLGTVSIDNYSTTRSSITVNIYSTVISDSVVVIPRGNDPNLGPIACT